MCGVLLMKRWLFMARIIFKWSNKRSIWKVWTAYYVYLKKQALIKKITLMRLILWKEAKCYRKSQESLRCSNYKFKFYRIDLKWTTFVPGNYNCNKSSKRGYKNIPWEKTLSQCKKKKKKCTGHSHLKKINFLWNWWVDQMVFSIHVWEATI